MVSGRIVLLVGGLVAMGACTSSSVTPETSPPTTTVAPSPTTSSTATTAPTTTSASTTTMEAPEPVLWADVTESAIGKTAEWSNKVDLADIDGDGDIDLLFADGGAYDQPGSPVVNQIWVNDGTAKFENRSVDVLGDVGDLARVIKARDLNGDGIVDIIVGTTFETQSRLYLGLGGLEFVEVTDTHLPNILASVGDIEVGDVDGDGDLDLVLADWGPGSPMTNEGAPPLLWLNDGTGVFEDVSQSNIPQIPVRFSWDLEFIDVDNDFDLDLAVSCKRCRGSFLFVNDGTGMFSDASDRMPQYSNNYDFEPIDLNGDGFLDLVTINDRSTGNSVFQENVFLADGEGGFVDATAELWPDDANLNRIDDNVVAVLDYDSDGDPDFVIGSLNGPDRLLVNDGTGSLTLIDTNVFGGRKTNGTLGLAFGDLNGDHRLDAVQAQGEVATDERVFVGNLIEPDTAPPVITGVIVVDGVVHARVHDNKSPTVPHDWTNVVIVGESTVDMDWYGEYLWRATATAPGDYQVCATDAAGNETCSNTFTITP